MINKCIQKGRATSNFPDVFHSDGKLISDHKDISNGFNDFFASVGSNLAKKIPKCNTHSFSEFIKFNSSQSMFLEPTCQDEIINVIRNFESKSSCDKDDLNMKIVKMIGQQIAKPLEYICNKSFELGIFPNSMKMAKIVPLFKSGESKSFNNYRPVSLLPQFSKILEKLFNTRLMNFVKKNMIFYSMVSMGFVKNIRHL